MFEFIDSADDVIALSISGKITTAELDAIMDRLEPALAKNEKTHVFVETRTIDGIEVSGLPSYLARAVPILTRLPRFGRVAIVADQTWVRIAARVESLLLPFISYRTFTPDQRDEALAWVRGTTAS
ncbi:STAS/SEC14 domain-containing protein [Sphingomonas sp. TDK1]|uniref:STAS/SEC14 domain-containing protein n=1 Tax=Sphingomonas sp. TDK1 TaxID=453247 RepID=UPI0007D9C317|nr:STAS/SEC14 domain-containing protein [Sphingomonas sp. TDK1]OAN64950.1 hypothetical protein A7X12_16380 [Sphingomonas sp. TDK1]